MSGRAPRGARRAVLDEVAAAVPDPSLLGRPALVAVDGVDGAGKTCFADELAHVLRDAGRAVERVSVDGFHHPREVRHARGCDSAEGFWRDSYDYAAFRREVLDPLGPAGNRLVRRAVHDVDAERAVHPAPVRVPDDAVVVVDGIFLHRDELAGAWDLGVLLHVPFAVSVGRMAVRDGSPPDPAHPRNRRYVEGQRLYLARCDPASRATLVVDNTDLAAPVLLRRG